MKLRITIAITVIILSGIFIIFRSKMSKNYQEILEELVYIYTYFYQKPVLAYYEEYGEYPLSIDEVIELNYKLYNIDRNQYTTMDPFSGKKILYLPLYDRLTNRKTSFLFISSGIDKKLDCTRNLPEKLYMDDWYNVLKLYNIEEAKQIKQNRDIVYYLSLYYDEDFIWENNLIPNEAPLGPNFSTWNYFFGNKDFVVTIGHAY